MAPGHIEKQIARLRLHMRLARLLVILSAAMFVLGIVFIILSEITWAVPILVLGGVSWVILDRWTRWLEKASLKVLDAAKARGRD